MVFDRNNPFPARLIYRKRLTSLDSQKNVQHIVFDISGSDMVYKCGDSVAIFPKNNLVEVATVIEKLHLQPQEMVKLAGREQSVTLLVALQEYCGITHLPKKFLEWFAGLLEDNHETEYIDHHMLCEDDECKVAAKSYSLLEMVEKFSSVRAVTAQALVDHLNKLSPRLYSIASSPLSSPNELHLVVNVVNYTNAVGNERHGIASTYLGEDMIVGQGTANLFIVRSLFALPTDYSIPVIMVGPGTGVAPFRGFLQERAALLKAGKAVGRNWLFFGDRNYKSDFLFKDEFLDFQKEGVLTHLNLAFSRDQAEKIYVQDRLWENREELWSWILDGACFYVCGNASRMAVDVETMFRKIAQEVGHMSPEQTDDFLKKMIKERRYQKDVY